MDLEVRGPKLFLSGSPPTCGPSPPLSPLKQTTCSTGEDRCARVLSCFVVVQPESGRSVVNPRKLVSSTVVCASEELGR